VEEAERKAKKKKKKTTAHKLSPGGEEKALLYSRAYNSSYNSPFK
jgi:hypothetical protein